MVDLSEVEIPKTSGPAEQEFCQFSGMKMGDCSGWPAGCLNLLP